MRQDGLGDGFEVFHADKVAAVEDSVGFGAADQVLNGARAGAPGDPFVHGFAGVSEFGAGFADEVDGGVVDVIGRGDALDDFLKAKDLFAGDEFGERFGGGSGGFAGDAAF